MQILWKFCPFCGHEQDDSSTPPCPHFLESFSEEVRDVRWQYFCLDLNLAVSRAQANLIDEDLLSAARRCLDECGGRGVTAVKMLRIWYNDSGHGALSLKEAYDIVKAVNTSGRML